MNISPQELAIRTTSFPNQKIDNKKMDALNDDVRFPTRYEVYYKSKRSNVLAKVNFIFMPGNEVSSFLTINSIDQLENPNIVEQYADLKRPLFDEYIISQPGCLIVLNFVDLSNEDDNYGKKHRAFIEETTKFYSEFEAVLLEVNHTGR